MNSTAVDFIKQHEGCKLSAYQDQGGVWTIGYGATGPGIKQGLVWTQAQADARLQADIAQVTAAVLKLLHVMLSEQQMAALISFAFNLGSGALATSHLLSSVNDRDWLGSAKAFIVWDHVGHEEVCGLLIRRLEEAALFLRGS